MPNNGVCSSVFTTGNIKPLTCFACTDTYFKLFSVVGCRVTRPKMYRYFPDHKTHFFPGKCYTQFLRIIRSEGASIGLSKQLKFLHSL